MFITCKEVEQDRESENVAVFSLLVLLRGALLVQKNPAKSIIQLYVRVRTYLAVLWIILDFDNSLFSQVHYVISSEFFGEYENYTFLESL